MENRKCYILISFVILFALFALFAPNLMEKNDNGDLLAENADFSIEIDKVDDEQIIDEIKSQPPKTSGSYGLNNLTIDNNGGTIGAYTWTQAVSEDWCYYDGYFYVIENVTIDATTSPTGSGIKIMLSNEPFIIRNCTVYSSGNGDYDGGIKLMYVQNGNIIGNNCSNNDNSGIQVGDDSSSCTNITIANNIVANNENFGIYIRGGSLNKILNNTVLNNGAVMNDCGICIYSSDYNIIFNNTVLDNYEYGIYIRVGADSNEVLNNTIYYTGGKIIQLDGILIYYNCYNNIIANNTIYGNDLNGIRIRAYGSSQVSGTEIIGNKIYDHAQYGIYIWGPDSNTIKNNTIYHNLDSGIYIHDEANGNTIINNSINENGVNGIKLMENCNTNNILENIFFNNSKYGIYINDDCDSNIFRGNIIKNNTLIGAFLDDSGGDDSENNQFYENRFLNNTLHAYDDVNAINYWYDFINKIGNYWDNYTGTDPDDDGIGDIVYEITGEAESEDLYPIKEDGDENPPTVLFIKPLTGIYGPAPLLINASITDYYPIISAKAMINASLPFNISMTQGMGDYWICYWNNISLYTSGDYNITIWAIDNYGVNATEYVVITIDTDGPSVSIIDPATGIYGPAPLLINASITDVMQAVAMINASLPFNISMTQGMGDYWICSWNNISLYTSGDYKITIWAIDNNGNINQTEYVVITIAKDGAPRVPAPGDDDDDDDEADDGAMVVIILVVVLVCVGAGVAVIFVLIKKGIIDLSKLKR